MGCGATTRTSRNGSPRRYVLGHNRRGSADPKGWINQGHRYIRVNRKPRALHRVIAEKKLGRPLSRDEIVHHIDGNPLNNDPDNLEVVTRQQHFYMHMVGEYDQPWADDEIARASRCMRRA
jgi:hypothetical protein